MSRSVDSRCEWLMPRISAGNHVCRFRPLLPALLLLVVAACTARQPDRTQRFISEETDKAGSLIKYEYYLAENGDRVLDGIYVMKHWNGLPFINGHMKNGRLDGRFEMWGDDGQKRAD